MEPINFFESVDFLEPKKCKCGSKIEFGLTTNFDEKKEAHICNECGSEVE